MSFNRTIFSAGLVILLVTIAGTAQTKRRPRPAASPSPSPVVTEPQETRTSVPQPSKRNERPGEPLQTASVRNIESPVQVNVDAATFIYQFDRPGFNIESIKIQHDESGKGTISFVHKDHSESITDPVVLSAGTLANLRQAFGSLNFLESTENYQFEKDYSHLGNVKITLSKGGRTRTATYNWTQNKDAKLIADEYRKISNQYIWMFDINTARENQPLETPKLFSTLEGYLRRNEISDPSQMLPFLRELTNDERMPLMARNHAARLIKQIEKSK